MSWRERRLIGGVQCDAFRCSAEFKLPVWGSALFAYDEVMNEASGEGWTFWAGRSQRHYCPDHKPRPGHGMREITR